MSNPGELRVAAAEWQADMNEIIVLTARIADLQAAAVIDHDLIAGLEAKLAACEEQNPPGSVRTVKPFGPDGGGGMNNIVADSLGGLWMGTDVGGVCHADPGSWTFHKCNAGLGSNRHIASLTEVMNGVMLLQGGAPGGQEGAWTFDVDTHTWEPLNQFAASKRVQVNSQNSDGWGLGIGHRYARSAGSLTFLRDNGDLVGGEFGYAPPGAGICVVKPNGTTTIVPGTEQWAVRDLKPFGSNIALACVWKGGTKVTSPGGIWGVPFDGGPVNRLWPHIIEAEDCHQNVVAARNQGIFRDGQDITFNLNPASWWYCVSVHDDGSILAGCIEPKKGPDGKFWSWVMLPAGSTTWKNLGAKVDPSWKPPNAGNVLGGAGCTVTGVAWRDMTPVMSGGGGICWYYVEASNTAKPANEGCGIIVVRDLDRHSGEWAMATSDFRCMTSKDGKNWKREAVGGSNDGMAVSFGTDGLLYCLTDRVFKRDAAGNWSASTVGMPAQQPQPGTPDPAVLQLAEIERFGERHGEYWLSDSEVYVYGHGAAVSRLEEV